MKPLPDPLEPTRSHLTPVDVPTGSWAKPSELTRSAIDGDPTEPNSVPPAMSVESPVPGYEVLGELGRGGMGVVFKARQIGLNRLVALKTMLSQGRAADHNRIELERRRFLQEGEAVARLNHPNVIAIYDIGTGPNGQPYFAMEFVSGGTLGDLLRDDVLSPKQAADTVGAIADGVQAAHTAGIVHRDLKPANVLMSKNTPNGNIVPKVTDFGLVKFVDSEENDLASPGSIMGTPCYMAPEQAAGGAASATPAADVWAFGAILYHTLTGRPPFRGPTVMETLRLVRETDPVPPSRLQPNVPRDLEAVCLKCLEKSPARRYPSAGALATDLRRFRDGEPTEARPVNTIGRLVKWCKRRPALAGMSGLSVTVVSAAFAIVLWQLNVARVAEKSARDANDKTSAALISEQQATIQASESAKKAADAEKVALQRLDQANKANEASAKSLAREIQATAETRDLLYSNLIGGADRAIQARDFGTARDLLDECDPERRSWEWSYLDGQASGRVMRSPFQFASLPLGLSFSPDGRRLASYASRVEVWDVERAQFLPSGGDANSVVFLPNGKLLCGTLKFPPPQGPGEQKPISGMGAVLSFDIDNPVEAWQPTNGIGYVAVGHRRRDGQHLFLTNSGTIQRRPVSGGSFVEIGKVSIGRHNSASPTDRIGRHSFSSDGERLVVTTAEGGMALVDTTTGKVLASRTKVYQVRFDPSGKRLAVAVMIDNRYSAEIFMATDGRLETTLQLSLSGFSYMNFDFVGPDRFAAVSNMAVSSSAKVGVRAWKLPGGEPLLNEDLSGSRGVVGDAIGKRIACIVGDTVHVFDLDVPGGYRRQYRPGKGKTVYTHALSPDGTRLATATDQLGVQVWDLDSGPSKLEFPGQFYGAKSRFDGDKLIVTNQLETQRGEFPMELGGIPRYSTRARPAQGGYGVDWSMQNVPVELEGSHGTVERRGYRVPELPRGKYPITPGDLTDPGEPGRIFHKPEDGPEREWTHPRPWIHSLGFAGRGKFAVALVGDRHESIPADPSFSAFKDFPRVPQTVVVREVVSGKITYTSELFDPGIVYSTVSLSDRGETLVAWGTRQTQNNFFELVCRSWDLRTGTPRTPVFIPVPERNLGIRTRTMAFDSSGWWTAFGWIGGHRLFLVKTDDPTVAPVSIMMGGNRLHEVCFTKDGKRAVSSSSDGRIQFWQLPNGREVSSIPLGTGVAGGLSFSDDGSRLAMAIADHNAVRVYGTRPFPAAPTLLELDRRIAEGVEILQNRWRRGLLHSKAGQWSQAVADLEVAAEGLGHPEGLNLDLGEAYYQAREWQKLIPLTAEIMGEPVFDGRPMWWAIEARAFGTKDYDGAATAADTLGKLRPYDYEVAVTRAALLLLADRTDDHIDYARAIAKQAIPIKVPCRNANLVARIMAFFPEPPIPREEFLRYAELGSRQDRGPWALHPLAMAYLRDGNAKKALELFDTALSYKDWKEGHIINLYGKVLALKALGNQDEMRKTLDAARRIVAEVEARKPPHWPLHPHDYLSFRILQREADPE